jgi:hypothetical protein
MVRGERGTVARPPTTPHTCAAGDQARDTPPRASDQPTAAARRGEASYRRGGRRCSRRRIRPCAYSRIALRGGRARSSASTAPSRRRRPRRAAPARHACHRKSRNPCPRYHRVTESRPSNWLRRMELHHRPPGYEPDELLLLHAARKGYPAWPSRGRRSSRRGRWRAPGDDAGGGAR